MAQIRPEIDKEELERNGLIYGEPKTTLIDLTNCVILSIEDYDDLKERLRKYETQFKELTASQREGEVDRLIDFCKIIDLDENACKLALKNGIKLDDFVKGGNEEWQTLADRFITTIGELKDQAYGLCLKHIEVMLRVKENEKKKGTEQPQ